MTREAQLETFRVRGDEILDAREVPYDRLCLAVAVLESLEKADTLERLLEIGEALSERVGVPPAAPIVVSPDSRVAQLVRQLGDINVEAFRRLAEKAAEEDRMVSKIDAQATAYVDRLFEHLDGVPTTPRAKETTPAVPSWVRDSFTNTLVGGLIEPVFQAFWEDTTGGIFDAAHAIASHIGPGGDIYYLMPAGRVVVCRHGTRWDVRELPALRPGGDAIPQERPAEASPVRLIRIDEVGEVAAVRDGEGSS